MTNKKYSPMEIQQIRDLKHLTIDEIVRKTGRKKQEVIYIKQKYRIYKTWNENHNI